MKYRRKLKKGKSRKLFKRTASRTHKRNVKHVMRGGTRL